MNRNIIIMLLVVFTSVVSFAVSYTGLPKGTIYQAYVEYVDPNTIVINPGYGECNGHYFEITSDLIYDVNYIPTGEDFIYLYVDDSESSYPTPTLCDTTIEPEWSDSQLGWYNGDDRCIGVVWTADSSSCIMEFASNSKLTYIMVEDNLKRVLYEGNPTGDTDFEFLETTAYIPVNAVATRVYAHNWDVDSYVSVVVRAEGVKKSALTSSGYYVTKVMDWLELERGCSRDLEWYGENNDDNDFCIDINGYQIER